jgi:hypothetical protein
VPDAAAVDVALAGASGDWAGEAVDASRLRLLPQGLVLEGRNAPLEISFADLTGGAWRTGRLVLHGTAGSLVLESEDGMERLWAGIVAGACKLPEFTRGLRVLGSRRAGTHDAHHRFFAPLLHARRRLEEERDPDRQVEAFDAPTLRARLAATLAAIAAESWPDNPPERRSLEAEFEDLTGPLRTDLDALEAAAAGWRAAPESARFSAFRSWRDQVSRVFVDADSAWAAMQRLVPAAPVRAPRRARWRRGGLVLLLALVPGTAEAASTAAWGAAAASGTGGTA